MREIVLDTETTGLDCSNGDRIVEILDGKIIDGYTRNEYPKGVVKSRRLVAKLFKSFNSKRLMLISPCINTGRP